MKKLRKLQNSILITMFCLYISNAYSQQSAIADSTNISTKYRQIGIGFINPIYRDFATSPLFYRGTGANIKYAGLKRSIMRERLFEIAFGYALVNAKIPKSKFFQPIASGSLMQLNIRYQQLWRLQKISSQKNNIKIGGTVQVTQNLRKNPYLSNNSTAFDNISNIMLTGQIKRDVSRKEKRKLNLWIFKPTLKAVKRDLKFQFNAGILNFNYRPSYAYIYLDEINGSKTKPIGWSIRPYRWSLNGWRFNTEIEYIKYLPNGNSRSWSYVWDALNAPGKFEKFQMASHQIRFTYYFK
jgi:hypothetical protein